MSDSSACEEEDAVVVDTTDDAYADFDYEAYQDRMMPFFELAERMVDLFDLQGEDESFADFYWRWSVLVDATIDSIHRCNPVLFELDHSQGDLYERAMALCDSSIDCFLTGGSQSDMNYGSYLYAVTENYLMLRQSKSLCKAFPKLNLRKEYTLYNEYASVAEAWMAMTDREDRGYSSRPMEINVKAHAAFAYRRQVAEEMLEVVCGKVKSIPEAGTRITHKRMQRFFSRELPKWRVCVDDKSDSIYREVQQRLYAWWNYREKLADKMDIRIAQSYRNQTQRILHDIVEKGELRPCLFSPGDEVLF